MIENKMKSIVGLALVVLLAAVGTASAQRVFLADPSGYWNTGDNWSSGTAIPQPAESTFIRNGWKAIVTNDVGSVSKMILGGASDSGTVEIQGGKLVVTGNVDIEIGRRGSAYNNSAGTLSISGGTFQAGDSSGSVAALVGADNGNTATGLLEISGSGTFIGRAIIGSTGGTDNDIFRIVGSNATVGNTSTTGENSLEFRSGTMEWVFDAAGISTANFQEIVTFGADSDGIIVDGSAYTGGAQTFTLLNAGQISATAPTIQLNGFAAGTTYDWNSTTDTFTVSVVPEPATMGLLGLGALALILRRRFFV